MEHNERIAKCEKHKTDVAKLRSDIAELKDLLTLNAWELDALEESKGVNEEQEKQQKAEGGENPDNNNIGKKSKDQLLEDMKSFQDQLTFFEKSLEEKNANEPPRHDRIQRNCRLCNKQSLYFCKECSKDATAKEGLFACCKPCLPKHVDDPSNLAAVHFPNKKRAKLNL